MLHSHSVIYVSNPIVKSILIQQEVGCNHRGARIAKVQEFDIDIKPTNLVRGNTLCRAMAEDQQIEGDDHKVLMVSLQDPWFSNITYYLTYGECPNGLTKKQGESRKIKL